MDQAYLNKVDGRCGLNPFKTTPHLLKQHICIIIFTHFCTDFKHTCFYNPLKHHIHGYFR
jgi:hypothetical protein